MRSASTGVYSAHTSSIHPAASTRSSLTMSVSALVSSISSLLSLLVLLVSISQTSTAHSTFSPSSSSFKIVPWAQNDGNDKGRNLVGLTVPGVANRGAVWLSNGPVPVEYHKWTLDVVFSVKGQPDDPQNAGTAGIGIWYVSAEGTEGPVHGSNDKWDGLGVLIDSAVQLMTDDINGEEETSNAKSVGTIRGHLNDGTITYDQTDPSRQAFSQCQLSYRNTDTDVHVKVSYMEGFFRIMVDGRHCFQTDLIHLPRGGYFGVTASTPDGESDGVYVSEVKLVEGIEPGVEIPVDRLLEYLEDQASELRLIERLERQRSRQHEGTAGDTLQAILHELSIYDNRHSVPDNADIKEIEALKNEFVSLKQTQLNNYATLDAQFSTLESVINDHLLLLYDHAVPVPVPASTADDGDDALTSISAPDNDLLAAQLTNLHAGLDDFNGAVNSHSFSFSSLSSLKADSTGSTPIWIPLGLYFCVQVLGVAAYYLYKKKTGHDGKIV